MHSTRFFYVTHGLMAGVLILAASSLAGDTMDIGSQRQLFVDRTLIESLRDARLGCLERLIDLRRLSRSD